MRLICGLWHLDGRPASSDMLHAMCEAQQSPTRRAIVDVAVDGNTGLAVMDFSLDAVAGTLLQRGPGSLCTAVDVRLDNPLEARLAAGLPSGAAEAESAAALLRSDTPSGITSLLGDFALAQWDLGARRLRLCRDSMGIRPLVFHHIPGRHVIFASLPSGIFASGLVERRLDEEQLALEVLRVFTAGGTLFQDVRAVKPGHIVQIDPQGLRESCYWEPRLQTPLRMSQTDAAHHLRELLNDAVTAATGQTGPVATHLSGGLDSSGLAILAARSLRAQARPLLAYSFLGEYWPGLQVDGETPFVQAVLQQELDIQWKAITHTLPENWLHDHWHPDMPFSLSSTAPDNAICADAAGHGASRILSGWGGDEGVTFNGRGALPGAFRNLRWLYLLRELNALQTERGVPMGKAFLGDVVQPLLPASATIVLRRWLRRRPVRERPEPGYLSEAVRNRLPGRSAIESLPDARASQLQLLRSAHLAQRTTYYATMGAQHGMAFCFPMLNRHVIDFALSMPGDWHIGNGWKRRVYRDAMDGILPPSIRNRHTKLVPLPGVNYEMSRARLPLQDRLRALRHDPVVSRIFNVDRFLEIAESIPDVADVQDPTAEPAYAPVPTFAHTLAYMFFVEQHFGGLK